MARLWLIPLLFIVLPVPYKYALLILLLDADTTQVLSTVNSVHERVGELQRQSYDASNPAHVALLDSLWESLMPDTRRTDWAPLGFQNGSKPESDLRGMGMLGEM